MSLNPRLRLNTASPTLLKPVNGKLVPFCISGFTLLELMVVLAIAGILVAIGAPSFTSVIENGKVVSARDSITNAVKMARSEAVYDKTTVSICASDDQDTCRGGTDWSDGWIIFEDVNGSGAKDAGEDISHVSYGEPGLNMTGASAVTFSPSGIRSDGGGALTFTVASAQTGIETKCLAISLTGSTTYLTESDAGCP